MLLLPGHYIRHISSPREPKPCLSMTACTTNTTPSTKYCGQTLLAWVITKTAHNEFALFAWLLLPLLPWWNLETSSTFCQALRITCIAILAKHTLAYIVTLLYIPRTCVAYIATSIYLCITCVGARLTYVAARAGYQPLRANGRYVTAA